MAIEIFLNYWKSKNLSFEIILRILIANWFSLAYFETHGKFFRILQVYDFGLLLNIKKRLWIMLSEYRTTVFVFDAWYQADRVYKLTIILIA